MNQKIDTLIIGGGQGGLSLSYHLKQAGIEHLVLEKSAHPGDAWRNQRWDSFTLVTPNWSFKLPGGEYDGPDPNGYMTRDEIVARFEQYPARHQLPVRYGVTVKSVTPGKDGEGFVVRTDRENWHARRVVMATGLYQRNKIPPFARKIPLSVQQIESGSYRNPRGLALGAVLVVGSGQSGAQIAEELNRAGRQVYLSVGKAGQLPRRYRGRDLYEWIMLTGFLDRTVDQLPSPAARFIPPPLLSGKDGGHALNLHQFHRDGIHLAGHLCGFQDSRLQFALDLKDSLSNSDQQSINMTRMVDAYIEKNGIDAPPDQPEMLKDGYTATEIVSLDIRQAGITTIIWAAGYSFDFKLVKFPVFDTAGFPISQGGVTQVSGLYFAGLPWLDTQKTGLLLGVGESTARLAEHIAAN